MAPNVTTGTKTQMKKVSDAGVEKLKQKLVEVRKIGAHPIYVEVKKNDTFADLIAKADIPIKIPGKTVEIKIEASKDGKKWEKVELATKAYVYVKAAVTTKVKGA